MEDRIQINGVWYKREEDSVEETESTFWDVTDYIGKVAESKLYVFKAERIYRDGINSELYSVSIEFTDKRFTDNRALWKTELWDNPTWMRGVLNNSPDALEDLRDSVCEQGEKEFKEFLRMLQEEGWLDE
jgi:hypothetical protein